MPDRTGPRIVDVLVYLLGVALLSASLTILWLSMRAVMDVGGMCASGGPYAIRVECPDAVAWLLPLSIFTGLGGVGLVAWFGGRIGPGFAAVAALAWPALFLSLGWNFLEYALTAPGGWDVSWLICGVLFLLMGGVPLVVAIQGMRGGSGGSRSTRGGVHMSMSSAERSGASGSTSSHETVSASVEHVELGQLLRQLQGVTVAEAAEITVGEATHGAPGGSGLVEQLERLARLRDHGKIGESEYLEAQQAVIDAAAKGGSA
jgi:hypothetical protein